MALVYCIAAITKRLSKKILMIKRGSSWASIVIDLPGQYHLRKASNHQKWLQFIVIKGSTKCHKTYHRFYNSHLIRGQYQLTERPTLINNWEATYFDFDEEKLEQIVDEGRHWELNCLFWMTVGLVHEKMI